MERVRAECYAGHQGAERPLRFEKGGIWREVVEITDRWREPEDSFFRVRADDGAICLLRQTQGRDEDLWMAERASPPSAPSHL